MAKQPEQPAASASPALADPTPPAAATYARIPLTAIVPNRWNRDWFDEGKLAELAESIRRQDVLQPILVRPLPGSRVQETSEVLGAGDKRPEYEIVAGERRWRASQLAGRVDIPTLVRAMTDQEVLESQLVENLQREDLHPLQEAEGYQRLCDQAGVRKEDIGAKIHKSRTYVYNRLKLLTLGAEAREAFRAGKLDVSRAELLATVAAPKLQLKALKEFTDASNGRVKSVRECSSWLEQNVLLKLDHAPFDTKDAALCAEAGACTGCPKRTHADRDLFAAFDGADMCVDPPCFRAKEQAHLERLRADAAAKGMELIAGKEARSLRPSAYQQDIRGYTRLDAKIKTEDGEATVSKMLGKDCPTPKLFIDPHDHKPVKVVPTEAVEKALKDRGLLKSTRGERDRKAAASAEREELQQRIQQEHERRAVAAVNERLCAGGLSAFTAAVLRIHVQDIARGIQGQGSTECNALLLRMWGLPAIEQGESWEISRQQHEAVLLHVSAAPDGAMGVMLLQVLLAQEAASISWMRETRGGTPMLTQLAQEVGVDLQALLKEVQQEMKPPPKAKPPRPDTAGAEDAPGATFQAAPQGSVAREPRRSAATKAGGAGGKADAKHRGKAGKRGAKAAPARKPKLSAQQAQQGIAEAMQGVKEPGVVAGVEA